MSSDAFLLARIGQSSDRGSFLQRSVLITLLLPFFVLAGAFGQANVNEGLETATIYVSTTGSDSNPGTKSAPFKTINAAASLAVSNNQAGIGTKVIINPGTYRESVTLQYSKRDTSLPITFQAATNGTVVVSGATVYSGWGKYSANPSIYTNSWNNNWSECPQLSSCPFQQDIMMRKEMIAVNGTVLTQVMSLGQILQGTFFVDSSSDQVYVWPASGTNMSTATVEAASLPALFTITHKSNIVVRGLTFQYSNSCRGSAAVVVNGASTNVLIDTDVFQWNNAQGFSVSTPATNFTVENSVSNHNGDSGFQEATTKNGLWQSDTASYNNWRGAQGAYYACNTAGLHAWEAHNDTITNVTTSFNQGYGIHWDTDNANISTSGINATSNLLSGLFAEKDEGPITLAKSFVCNQNSPLGGGGVILRNSEGVSLTNSVVMNNLPNQIAVIGTKGGIEVRNWETGVSKNLVTQNFTNKSNTIQGNSSTQLLFRDSYLNGSDWTTFQDTLVSSGNTWWNSENTTTPFVVPTPKSGSKDDFPSWQGATLQDTTSTFKQPSGTPGAACSLNPVGTDYWVNVNYALISVSPGGTATYTLTVTPLNFNGTVKLSVDGISEVPGLSSSFSPSSVPASGSTAGTSTFTVTAGTRTERGTYSIAILANSGSITRTVTVQLAVN